MNDIIEKYLIADREFVLDHEQSWEEIEELEKLFDRLEVTDNKTITINGNYTREEIKKALFLILKPSDGKQKRLDEFAKATPQVSMKIILDFFFFIAARNVITSKVSQMYRKSLKTR